MKVYYASDIHLEFELSTDPDNTLQSIFSGISGDVLILAGDITTFSNGRWEDFVEQTRRLNFNKIFFLPGNHEFYHNDLEDAQPALDYASWRNDKFTSLNNDECVYKGVKFIGTTLWSDMSKFNGAHTYRIQDCLNDYKLITVNNGERNVAVRDFTELYERNVDFIIDGLTGEYAPEGPSVVITHHAPSYKSVEEKFKGNVLNCAFVNDLDKLIEMYKPNFWVHGHVHSSHDYMIGDCRVMANPRGYYDFELNPNFNSYKFFEVEND